MMQCLRTVTITVHTRKRTPETGTPITSQIISVKKKKTKKQMIIFLKDLGVSCNHHSPVSILYLSKIVLQLFREETKVRVSLLVSNRRKTRRPSRSLCTIPHCTLSRASDEGRTPPKILLSFPPTLVKLRREPALAILPKSPRKHSETPRHFCQLLTLPRTH
jgi:hypothetical protein